MLQSANLSTHTHLNHFYVPLPNNILYAHVRKTAELTSIPKNENNQNKVH
jgi:hypothetical protein